MMNNRVTRWLCARLLRVLSRVPERRPPDFVIGDRYLERWWLIPRNPVFNLYLHRFNHDDDDRACHDHPWVSASFVLSGPMLEVVRAWRFEYVTMGTWAKRTKTGKLRWGTGYRLRSTSEPFLIGVRGSPKNARNVPSHIDGLAREHSRKPEEAYAAAERLMPHARRADVFSRQRRPGWDSFGDEDGKFDEVAALN
jgi:hypothetical protein